MSPVGRRHRPLDWQDLTSGGQIYSADLRLPGMLVGRILRSPHAHARILALDVEAARACPGVRAVITAADFPPGARYLHEGAADRPPLADGVVRFVGQEVAAVAADTAEAAEAALRTIRVRYRLLRAPLDIAAALAPGAARLHERPSGRANVAAEFRRRWGDPEAGVAASVHSVAGSFWFPPQYHACMEPGVALAQWSPEDERLYVWTSTAAPYYVVREVAHVMGLEPDQVACREVGVGGSFGARTKVCDYEAIAGQLSRVACQPVRIVLTREEDFATTKTRHGFRVDLRLHGDVAGRLRALQGQVLVDNGAYSHSGGSVMGAGVKGLGMQYEPDGLDVSAVLVDTAKQPGGQFRGYGTTQTSFALECLVDALAEASGLDPVDYRLRNANRPGGVTLVGARLGSSRLAECLQAARAAIRWDAEKAEPRAGQGVGMAAAVHVSGSYVGAGANRSDCAIDIHDDGRILLRFGSGDAGTGQKTILAQIAAQELGVPMSQVSVLSMDSDRTPFDMGSWSSRGTHYTGHAARMAGRMAAERLRALAAAELGVAEVRLEDGWAWGGGTGLPFGELVRRARAVVGGVLTVEASYVEPRVELSDKETGRGNISPSYNFAAHAARVRVDGRTGRITVIDYVAAHDVGAAINPGLVEGQIVGGAVQGLGVALGEEVIHEQGKTVNAAFIHYALPRAADLPSVRPIIVGGEDPHGPYGAKAVGETGINPPAAAIANAVYDAVGVRLRSLPLTPDKVLTALAAKAGRRRDHALWRRPDRWWIAITRWAYPRGLFRLLHRRVSTQASPAAPAAEAALDRPSGLDGLRASLAAGAAPLGGGTDLLLRRRIGLPAPSRLAAVGGVAELGRIERLADGGWRIGAGVVLADLSRGLAADLPALADAVDQIASPQVREMATLGGNLLQANRCWFLRNGFDCYKRRGGVAPCYAILGDHRFYHAAIDGHRCQSVTPSDLAAVLAALDAEVVVVPAVGGGERRIPVTRLYAGPGEPVLGAGELLTHVLIPAFDPRMRMSFQKLNLWTGDFAIASVMAVARVDDLGLWRDIRLCLGGVAPTPRRARWTEAALEGHAVTAALLRRTLDRELDACAHPLDRNGWKLDAVAGLAEHAADAINAPAQGRGSSEVQRQPVAQGA
jgi:CO/xanthine dehydrogenase Mo-binding subunit/CO/xanthine dehydrogenase FAD-binding subunit